jgi:hypothetical protein
VLVKRFFFLLNAAFAMAILDLISQLKYMFECYYLPHTYYTLHVVHSPQLVIQKICGAKYDYSLRGATAKQRLKG